ncbi:PaaI family thioesterase [Roseibium salinum]|uniref:PaaI family thioesterase n=1 Tax=Roseibium salinum TaxID=1604349 RepID=A0ABT3QZT9_9HYPH|nr:PaaI family thioesterase [Roseibium sp. DSM 29163]MCX2722360.1 PaaI family thioesterase [Roseibium sp. DSM 29163]MDN3719634.1 PaaI family thioesterase [Roseibium salinum]
MTDTHVYKEDGPAPGPLPMAAVASLSGMDIFARMMAGELPAPPIMMHLNIRMKEFSEGRSVFTGMPAREFLNPQGTVHGGWISTLIDTALSCAVHTALKPGEFYTTTSLTVNMVRPLKTDSGEVTCEGRLVHRGSRLATSEGDLRDARGKLIAHGTVSCMILRTS